jgi:hypothetical protein
VGTTPNYGFPYPGTNDPPHGPNQVQALALAADTALQTADTARQAADTALDGRLDVVEAGHVRLLARGRRDSVSANSTSPAAVAVLRIDGVLGRAGRSIMVRTGGIHPTSSVNTDNIRVEIRYATGGAAATTASSIVPEAQAYEAFGNTSYLEGRITPGADTTYSFLLCVARESGSGNANLYADANRRTTLLAYDEGVDPGDTGVDL